jgi:hypothetical protein
VKCRKLVGIEQRLGSVEQRCEQCRKLDHGLARIGCAAADSDAEAASDRGDLGEQTALAHACAALHHDHRFGSIRKTFELTPNQREFRVASVELPRWDCRHRLLPASIPQGLDQLSNRRIVRCEPARV